MERFIKNLSRGAGAILREGFRKKFKISYKTSIWDVVTEYDLASEKMIMQKIKKRFPDHGIISEENGQYFHKRKNLWVIDPLDGTHAFSRGLAQFSVSVAFVHNSQIKFGAVYDPIRDELFFAHAKGGATLNGRKISVSPEKELRFATLAMILGTGESTIREKKFFYNDFIVKYSLWNSKLESAALTLAYVACGRYDMVVLKHLSPWDNAAGGFIISEAGGKVTDDQGRPHKWNFTDIAAASPGLHKQMIKVLQHGP